MRTTSSSEPRLRTLLPRSCRGYGGGTLLLKESIPFLRRVALLARRFEGAKIHIDAHAGEALRVLHCDFSYPLGL